MRSIVEGAVDFRNTYDVIKGLIEDLNDQAPPPNPIDCINEYGQNQGHIDGRTDIETQFNGGSVIASDPMQNYMDAYRTCASDGPEKPDPIHLPSLVNPVVTFLEVALWPSTLGSGQDPSWAGQRPFLEGYQDGYKEGQIEGFDARLHQHFAQPEPDPVVLTPIDLMIPPLTAEPYGYNTLDNNTHNVNSYEAGSSGYSQPG